MHGVIVVGGLGFLCKQGKMQGKGERKLYDKLTIDRGRDNLGDYLVSKEVLPKRHSWCCRRRELW